MNNLALVIFSADINDDLWDVDKFLINKYWPNHPKIYLLTETKKSPFNTINFDYPINLWTKRIRESLQTIPEEYIIFMCDDCFIQSQVNEKYLLNCLDFISKNNNIANINFELSFSKRDISSQNVLLKFRPPKSLARISLLCGLWNKENLISILESDCSPWEVEKNKKEKGYDYYILKDNYVIHWLNDEPHMCGGIKQGKWHSNTKAFLKQEGYDISKLKDRGEI